MLYTPLLSASYLTLHTYTAYTLHTIHYKHFPIHVITLYTPYTIHYTTYIHIQDIIGKKAAVLQAQEANDVTLRRILSLIDPSTKEGRGKILVYCGHINLLNSLLYCVVYLYAYLYNRIHT